MYSYFIKFWNNCMPFVIQIIMTIIIIIIVIIKLSVKRMLPLHLFQWINGHINLSLNKDSGVIYFPLMIVLDCKAEVDLNLRFSLHCIGLTTHSSMFQSTLLFSIILSSSTVWLWKHHNLCSPQLTTELSHLMRRLDSEKNRYPAPFRGTGRS